MSKKLLMIGTAMLLTIGFTAVIMVVSCQDREHAKKISLEGERLQIPSAGGDRQEPLRVALAVLVSPKDTYGNYKKMFEYLSKKLGSPISIVHRTTVDKVEQLLKNRRLDVAFVCGASYIDSQGLELIVVPQICGQITTQSYFIVPANSAVTCFEELRNRSFCFTSQHCVSGYLLPLYILAQQGESRESFFKACNCTNYHTDTIEAVARNMVDGGAVNSLIWEYCNHRSPEFTSKTKIIKKSVPVSNPPIVVRSDMEAALKHKIRKIFLGMHEDIKGKEILESLMIDKFVSVDDRAYDSIRKIKESIDLKK